MVVASAVEDRGEGIYVRKWNHGFIDLPEIKNQRAPSLSSEEVGAIVAATERQYGMLCALLAGTGMRIGEELGLEVDKHITDDHTTTKVRQSATPG